jgi:hypothetical protein
MTMTSNAYIASDGQTVMKVGKTNNIRLREKQIGVTITVTVACLDESAAFQVESQLRDFVIEQGGIRHQRTIDWFNFDIRIYRMLCEFAAGIDAKPEPELDLDTEIRMLVARYYQLLFVQLKQYQTELIIIKNRIAELERQRQEERTEWEHQRQEERTEWERLRKEEREAAQTRIEGLLQEMAVLKYRLEQLEKDDDDE